uniref:Plectin/eS10 N-terminal domain-containing protein n=1 Tax=Anopheles atroparvus TaxID=41427 RepID=A0A182J381_ANOAO
MFMPKQFKSAIYAQLFREGVLVVKDKPLDMHPDLEGIPNLNVLTTMKSLQSRGYVKKQFNWNHSYYFLNNEGVVFLRNYLHLAQEIVPKTLMNANGRRAPLGHPRNVPAGSRLQTKSTVSHGRDNMYRVSHKE